MDKSDVLFDRRIKITASNAAATAIVLMMMIIGIRSKGGFPPSFGSPEDVDVPLMIFTELEPTFQAISWTKNVISTFPLVKEFHAASLIVPFSVK